MKAGLPVSPPPFNWKRTLFFVMLALVPIGVWVFFLASIAISTYTRESVVLSTPTNQALLVATFFMLAGLVMMAIQVANVIEHLVGTH